MGKTPKVPKPGKALLRRLYVKEAKSIREVAEYRTTEIYAHLIDKHLYHVVSMLPSPNMVTVLVTPAVLPGKGITQVIEKKLVGDTGFEPVTSTVCKRHKKPKKRKK